MNDASLGNESNLQYVDSRKDSLTVPDGKLVNGASSPENVLSAVQKLEISDRLVMLFIFVFINIDNDLGYLNLHVQFNELKTILILNCKIVNDAVF